MSDNTEVVTFTSMAEGTRRTTSCWIAWRLSFLKERPTVC